MDENTQTKGASEGDTNENTNQNKNPSPEALAKESIEYASLVVLLNSDIGRMVLHHTGAKSVRAFCRDCMEEIDTFAGAEAEEYAEI